MPWTPSPTQAGIKIWAYEQTAPASTWSINHGMGSNPMVEITAYDDSGVLQKSFPHSVTHVDDNNVTVQWSSPRRGFATLMAS